MTLTNGQRVTLLKIDDALAMTHRYELEVRRVLTPEKVGYQSRLTRLGVVRQRGKRKRLGTSQTFPPASRRLTADSKQPGNGDIQNIPPLRAPHTRSALDGGKF